MKHPIESWTYKQVERWRRQSACTGQSILHAFTTIERQRAIAKLQTLYPKGRIYAAFADRILYLSELH